MAQQECSADKRTSPRSRTRFTMAYGMLDDPHTGMLDIAQTMDIGMGGIRFATNRPFAPDTAFAISIRLPITTQPVSVKAKVLDSREIATDSIYETRVEFFDVDHIHAKSLRDTIRYFARKEALKGF